MRPISILLALFAFAMALPAQPLDVQIDALHRQLDVLHQEEGQLKKELENLKLKRIQGDLLAIGLPSDNFILHAAMALEYDEEHEQARWVAHIILPDIADGTVSRTNDFRPDPKVASGTAIEQDYFLKSLKPDSTYEYDGFGYDRGHLAPSADFRWSQRALSESYYYSNISPQLADFNRGRWAELESLLRAYLYRHPGTQLYVLTGGILTDSLAQIERSINKVSIPQFFFKVAVDLEREKGIGFILPNQKIQYPLEAFAQPIDEVEKRTGLDFFRLLPAESEAAIESKTDKAWWIPELAGRDAEPIYPPSLPPNHFNTIQAGRYAGSGEEVSVCGTVVSARRSRSGNLWMNIDKQFPNQVFSVFIREKDLSNFSYQPDKQFLNQQVCFTGTVENFNGTPTMNVEREEVAGRFEED